MRPKSWTRQRFTSKDKRIAKQLSDPNVDREFAERHIAAECERIRAGWTPTQRERAGGEAQDKRIEITVIATRDFWEGFQ